MAVLSWLQKLIGTNSRIDPDKAGSQPVANARPDRDGAIAYVVKLSGLVSDQPEAIAFYRVAFADHPNQFVTYDDLRKQGDLLNKETLKALGLRANVKLSDQFLGTLNERGRADPLGAASILGRAISKALCTLRDLADIEAGGIDRIRFRASNMAAGPCAGALSLAGQTFLLSDAPILPFETCPHPDQCACRYQAWLPLMDELGIE